MADSKITALTSISTSTDPANDPLVIVDVSDTSMAATGTTKKVTLNQLLGASGTATLASATITGDLTVDTSTLKVDSANHRVVVGHTSGSAPFQVTNAGAAGLEIHPTGVSSAPLIISYNRSGLTYTQLTIDASTIVYALNGSTAMTLNSTGLGVGVVSANGIKLSSFVTTDGAPATSGTTQTSGSLRIGAVSTTGAMDMGTAGSYSWIQVLDRGNLATNYDLVLQKNGGNVGIGVTSPAFKLSAAGVSQFYAEADGIYASGNSSPDLYTIGVNYYNAAGTEGVKVSARPSWKIEHKNTSDALAYLDIGFRAGSAAASAFTSRFKIDGTGNVISNVTGTAPTLATNSQMVFNLTSNTNLRISVRGTDGTTRTANITLA